MKYLSLLSFLLFIIVQANAFAAGRKDAFVIDTSMVKWVYDGDTPYLDCVQQHPCKDGKLGVRILGIDTPEIKGKCPFEKRLAQRAKAATEDMLYSAKVIEIIPNKKRVYDKYQRLLASIRVDGVDVGQSLLDQGLARVWRGRRENWCR